ncbi:hypothetical protein LguiA_026025 [Lonicera macranthoides]
MWRKQSRWNVGLICGDISVGSSFSVLECWVDLQRDKEVTWLCLKTSYSFWAIALSFGGGNRAAGKLGLFAETSRMVAHLVCWNVGLICENIPKLEDEVPSKKVRVRNGKLEDEVIEESRETKLLRDKNKVYALEYLGRKTHRMVDETVSQLPAPIVRDQTRDLTRPRTNSLVVLALYHSSELGHVGTSLTKSVKNPQLMWRKPTCWNIGLICRDILVGSSFSVLNVRLICKETKRSLGYALKLPTPSA